MSTLKRSSLRAATLRKKMSKKKSNKLGPSLSFITTTGGILTPEIQAALPYLAEEGSPLSSQGFLLLLRAAARSVRARGGFTARSFRDATKDCGISEPKTINIIFTGLYRLFKAAVEAQAGQEELKELSQIGLAPSFSRALATLLLTERTAMREDASANSIQYPSLERMKWRVDVAISTSSLSRCLQPSTTVQLRLSDGRLVAFDVPLAEFHNLRKGVAQALKDMQDLELHPVSRVLSHVEESDRASDETLLAKLSPK